METRYIIVALIFLLSFTAKAQYAYEYQNTTVTTPTGVPVNALQFKYWVYNDFTSEEQASENYQMTHNYNCEVISSSTKYYNCHGYAWHNVEGNMEQDKLRWIDDIDYNSNPTYNVHRYYSTVHSNGKPSYREVFTNNKANLKVSYFPRDHSAITTSNPEYLISKWAWGPLVKHAISQCPFYKNAQIKYYESIFSFSISGPTSVCNQATYTVENLPQGATVQWSTNNNSLQLASGQGTKTVVFRKNGTGENRIHAKISVGSVIRELEHAVWVGPPHPIVYLYGMTPGMNVYPGQEFTLMANTGTPLLNYRWDIYNGTIIEGYYNSPKIKVKVDEQTYGSTVFSVGISTWNSCGSVPEFQVKRTIVNNQSFTLSPNPATDAVTLQLMETDEVSGLSVLSTDRSPYEIQIWSGMTMLRSFRTNESTFQIPMAGLPAGLYFVRVVKDGQTYTQKLIKK